MHSRARGSRLRGAAAKATEASALGAGADGRSAASATPAMSLSVGCRIARQAARRRRRERRGRLGPHAGRHRPIAGHRREPRPADPATPASSSSRAGTAAVRRLPRNAEDTHVPLCTPTAGDDTTDAAGDTAGADCGGVRRGGAPLETRIRPVTTQDAASALPSSGYRPTSASMVRWTGRRTEMRVAAADQPARSQRPLRAVLRVSLSKGAPHPKRRCDRRGEAGTESMAAEEPSARRCGGPMRVAASPAPDTIDRPTRATLVSEAGSAGPERPPPSCDRGTRSPDRGRGWSSSGRPTSPGRCAGRFAALVYLQRWSIRSAGRFTASRGSIAVLRRPAPSARPVESGSARVARRPCRRSARAGRRYGTRYGSGTTAPALVQLGYGGSGAASGSGSTAAPVLGPAEYGGVG